MEQREALRSEMDVRVQEASRTGIANAGPCAAILAHAEGLQAHAGAVELRLEQAA